MSETNSVAVVGGGIGGLAAAIALSMSGRQVTVFEQAATFGEVGAGLQIGPNAVRALQKLGAFEKLEAFTHKPGNIRIMCGLSGRCLKVLPLGETFEELFGAPYRVAHRADLHQSLLSRAQEVGVEMKVAKAVTNVESDGTSVRPVVKGEDEAGVFDLLVGADGVRSKVREFVDCNAQVTPRGHSLFRGLVPDYAPGAMPNGVDVHLWLLPRGHVVHYPVSAGRALNIVAAFEEDWFEAGWQVKTSSDDVQAVFDRAAPALKGVLNSCQAWSKWAALGLSGAKKGANAWHRQRVCLLGDAVHPTLPYLAQGAAMAMEDAVELASALDATGSLESYAMGRWRRCARAVAEANEMGRVYHLHWPWRIARNIVIEHLGANRQLGRLGWIYNWNGGA